MRYLPFTALAVLVLLPASSASAQATAAAALPSTVTIADVMRLLDERSPRTLADRATVGVIAADTITAQTLPNPSISYGGVHLVQGLSTGAVTQHQIVIE